MTAPHESAAARRRAAAVERRTRRAEVTDVAVVMEAAAAYLAVRPRTVDETRRRLRHLGYRVELCEQTVDRLVELGYLDDAAFARAWVESRDRGRPRGEVALRRELRGRGVTDEAITAALLARTAGATGDDERHAEGETSGRDADARAAWRLIERRRASLEREQDPRRRRQKAYALLARNGFDPDLCQTVSRALVSDRASV